MTNHLHDFIADTVVFDSERLAQGGQQQALCNRLVV